MLNEQINIVAISKVTSLSQKETEALNEVNPK